MRYHLIRKGYAYGDRKLSDCADRYDPVRFYRDSHIKPRYLCIVAIFLFVTLGIYPTADTEQEQQQQKDTLSPDSSLQLASVEDFHAVEINKDTVSPEELSQSVALHTELELFLTPVEQEDLQKYLKEFQSNFGIQWLTNTLEAGAPYRPYIRQKLEEAGLPMALEYLPVIESEYKTTAKSRSGALGMWQFMENSIDGLLMKNDWVDERLDPWKSTDAAIKKLQDNYNWFQDWFLALAAYNAGPSHIIDARRLARKYGADANRWDDTETFLSFLKYEEYYTDPVVQYGKFNAKTTIAYVQGILRTSRMIHHGEFAMKRKRQSPSSSAVVSEPQQVPEAAASDPNEGENEQSANGFEPVVSSSVEPTNNESL